MTEEEFRSKDNTVSFDANTLVVGVNLPAFDYVVEAHVTLSPEFHGNRVSRQHFSRALNDSIHALQQLDKVKKSLFYGRDNNLDPAEGMQDCSLLPVLICGFDGPTNEKALEAELLIHGIIGLATEAGELLELLKDTINSKPLDKTNLQEEVGDGKWYMAILARVGGFMWGDDERLNIAKLRARFPDKFKAYDANNRNLVAERAILEHGNSVNQLALPINERVKPMEGETRTPVARSGYVPQFSKSGDNI